MLFTCSFSLFISALSIPCCTFSGKQSPVDIYSEMEDKLVIMDYKTGALNDKILDEYKKQLFTYKEILKISANFLSSSAEPYLAYIHFSAIEMVSSLPYSSIKRPACRHSPARADK